MLSDMNNTCATKKMFFKVPLFFSKAYIRATTMLQKIVL